MQHPLFHARDKLPGPVIVDSDRTTLPNTLGLVYTRTHDVGQRMFLSHKIPQVVPPAAVPLISGLLKKHKLQVSDIEHWVIHPGGPKVLLNIEELCKFRTGAPSPKTGAIDLTAPLAWSWKALVDAGNCMSVSVFHVLHELQTSATPPKPGSRGILFGVGPGMRMEALLLQW
jgi:alkylresorcinol/alkylpyrone synthase